MSVAKTIRHQIVAQDRMAMFAWGAKDLVAHPTGLSFKSSGLATWKGTVFVHYNEGADDYTVEFFKIRKAEKKITKVVRGVYCDQLVSVIDSVVQ
jgi:hypothetical protein